MDTKTTQEKTKIILEQCEAFFVNVPRGTDPKATTEMFLKMMDLLKDCHNAIAFHRDRDMNVIEKVVMSSLKMAVAVPPLEDKLSKSAYTLLHKMGFTPEEITKVVEEMK